ncbi:hypothetical protein BGZ76_002983 [Entomortierella beljakovae]|nr:hypothetical protein BGZ76_002983 [Entomortierella beljakovae]
MKISTVCLALLSLIALLQTADAVIPFLAFWAVGTSTVIEFLAKITAISLENSKVNLVGTNLINNEIGLLTYTRGTTTWNLMICNKLAYEETKKLDRPYMSEVESTIANWVHGFGFYEDVSVIYPGKTFSGRIKCDRGTANCCYPHLDVYISYCPKGRGWDKNQLSSWDKSKSIKCLCENKCPAH